ncbi:non-homologous end-joining DNA ligase [Anaeromicropila herbilytica]|uniref:DNA ligase (ATP) n=1 Tax=Anaeromicropila herbilytica TaxID=2785025 RepID=A0A7R7ICL9_9FIRM|nr:non-homologous end-joining DNA ligase [Anaeromicropila herbilytica]BCN30888.1 ATP-dependent DNA ligase [Anaeromicropila herbilytica]
MDLFEQKAIKPMLISELTSPFNSEDWIYELKLDGIRCLAYLDAVHTELRNKRNMNLTPKFPELSSIHTSVKGKCILDGELIVLKNGVPDFYELQRRVMLSDTFKIQLGYTKHPASYVAYDLIYLNGEDMTGYPLLERKQLLQNIIVENDTLAISRYIETRGIELYQVAEQQKLEGVVAKRKDSKYYFDKRSKDWLKFKRLVDEDFVICGYQPNESKSYTLILGQYRADTLIYKGSVSFGVKTSFLQEYNLTRIDDSPFTLTPSGHDDVTWLKPELVCVVEYMPNTKDALRQPVFKGIRDDVLPTDCQIKNPHNPSM